MSKTTQHSPRGTRKSLSRIALPIIGSSLITTIVSTNDSLLLAGTSARTFATVAATSTVIFVATMLVSGVALPSQVFLARALGQRRAREGELAVNAAFSIGVWVAVPLAVCVALCAPWVVDGIGGTAVDASFGATYLRLTSFSIVLVAIASCLRGRASGLGATRIILISSIASAAVDVASSLVLMQVMGPLGVGVGTVLGHATACAVMLYAALKPHLHTTGDDTVTVAPVRLRSVVEPAGESHKQVFELGWPEAILAACSAGAGVVVAYLLSASPPTHLAASRLLEVTAGGVLWTIMRGYGAAATTLMASAIGATSYATFRTTLVQASLILATIAGVGLIVTPFAAPYVVSLLAGPDVATLAGSVVWLLALQGPFMAFVVATTSTLRALKDSRTPMFASLFSEYAIFLPIGFILTRHFHLEITGIFITHIIFWCSFSAICFYRSRNTLQRFRDQCETVTAHRP